ncbi:MarR family winged helix-turn-helix transcriptional regulator [Roseibium algae]|uniref:MarR family transcriptional regulator n=1 Tax=Roseibium algae TaxID=3123038 RepID=A0ABU8TH88_9HYPH
MNKSEDLYEIIRLIRPAHRRLARAVAAKLEGTGLTVGMRAVMEVLAEAAPMTVPDIARSLFLTRQQIQMIVNELEAKGQIERRLNPAHKRSPLFKLTKQGLHELGGVRAREMEETEHIADQFSSEELSAAQRVLCAMLDHFSAFEDDPDHPAPLE